MRVTGSSSCSSPRRMSWSIPVRKAARVLPDPVGAATRVSRPERMAGQAAVWASVGAWKVALNQSATRGWNAGVGRRAWRGRVQAGTWVGIVTEQEANGGVIRRAGQGAELGPSRAIRVFSKKLLRWRGVHFWRIRGGTVVGVVTCRGGCGGGLSRVVFRWIVVGDTEVSGRGCGGRWGCWA